jgi:hypothetical protein
MSDSRNTAVVNTQFVEDMLAGPGSEAFQKTAADIDAFLLDKMRERCFTDRIIELQTITSQDRRMVPSVNHDTLVFLDHIAPNTEACVATYRDRPDVEYVRGSRYLIPPFMIKSREYEKTVEELRVYPYPILRLIEDQVGLDMEAMKDWIFMNAVDSATQRGTTLTTGQYTAGRIIRGEQAVAAYEAAGGYDDAEGEPQPNDLVELGIIFSDSERPKGTLLMNKADHDRIAKWDLAAVGDEKRGKIAFEGLGEGSLGLGTDKVRVLSTMKRTVVQRGDIFLFAPAEYLGRNFVLNKIEWWAEKVRNMLRYGAWAEHMLGIGNIASIAKLELYNCSASKTPLTEAEVNTGVYNEAADGFTFPRVEQY